MAIDGTSYRPAIVTVDRGTRVQWANADPFPHTVTKRGVFDSGSMSPGARWSFIANKPGTYDYVCTLHPNMRGTLVVR